jgi:hypothetical protein
LHQDVSETSSHLLATLPITSVAAPDTNPARASDIAIIGIGTLLPKANYPETFWENILASVNTPEQIRNAILAEIIVPDAPNATTEPVPQSPRVTGPPGSAPSKLPKKNI